MSFPRPRLDRSLSITLFHPLARLAKPDRGAPLPVLMYHSLSENPEAGVMPYYKTNTAPQVFRRQIEYLAAEGYKTIDSKQLTEHLGKRRPLPPKAVFITFDDGFRDFYTHGAPVLREHGFQATMFLPTAFIQNDRRSLKRNECLTWDEVRQLRQEGMEFGSHTVNHPKLVELPSAEIERELVQSKAEIERELDEPISSFAYPYAFPQGAGAFTQNLRKALVEAGYNCCLTTELGRVKMGDDLYRVKRLPINSMDDNSLLRAKLDGGYDWVATPQKAFKRIKHALRSVFVRNSLANGAITAIP